MGYVSVRPGLDRLIAQRFGAKATKPVAERVASRARMLAVAKAKHSSVADRIDVTVHAYGTHHAVVMSVIGRDGTQVASFLEFGYFNRWLENKYGIKDPRAWMPGLRILSEAKYAA